jgi:hypothetical protein
VQVLSRSEGLDEAVVRRQMRHDPHLDLRVVGGEERGVAGADDERLPDLAALLGPDRDVLQVRVGARQPTRRRDGLLVGGVDPPVVRNRLDQPLDGLPQPGGVAVPEEVEQERVLGLGVELGERLGVGGVARLRPLGLRHAELVEQHRLQLLGRAEVDLLVDLPERALGRVLYRRREAGLERLEHGDVRRDAGVLHAGEDADER